MKNVTAKPKIDIGEPLPLYGMPGHLVRRLQQASVAIFLQEMEQAGLDLTQVQFAALMAVAHHPGIDQASLAGVIAYDRATIGGVIDRLEAKGLVKRTASPQDRRMWRLMIEPAGEDLLEAAAGAVAAVQRRIVAPLNAEEQTLFTRLMQKLVAAVNDQSRAPLRLFSKE